MFSVRLVFIFFIFSKIVFSQNKNNPTWFPEYENYIVNNDTLNYRILFPESFDESKIYPLHLFLHGIGERGSDNKKQLTYVNKVFSDKRNRKRFPAIVIFPQAPNTDSWSSRMLVKSPYAVKNRQML